MGLTEAVIAIAEHRDSAGELVDRFIELTGCREFLLRDGALLSTCAANSMKAADELAWTAGVSLAGYGFLVDGPELGRLADELARLIAVHLGHGDRFSLSIEDVSGGGGGGCRRIDLYDALVARLLAATEASIEDHRPDKLFTVVLGEGWALLLNGYRRGLGGLPMGTEGSASVLFSGGRCSASALLRAASAGFDPSPIYFEVEGATPPDELRRALGAASLLIGRLKPSGGTIHVVEVGETAQRAIGSLPERARCWAFHRFMARSTASALGARGGAIFVGVTPEPGYSQILDAYLGLRMGIGASDVRVRFIPILAGDCALPLLDEDLEMFLDGHRWRYAAPTSGWRAEEAEEAWSASDLDGEAEEAARRMISLHVEGPTAVHSVLDEYARMRARRTS